MLFHLLYRSNHPFHPPVITIYPRCGILQPTSDLFLAYKDFIAQLVEEHTGISKVMRLISVVALIFFFLMDGSMDGFYVILFFQAK